MSKPSKSRPVSAKSAKPRSRKIKAEPIVDIAGTAADPTTSVDMLRGALSEDVLNDQAVTDLMLHCASVLAFRRAFSGASPEAIAGYCYRGVGGTDMVSIYSNGFKVGSCSRDEAQTRGIPACG